MNLQKITSLVLIVGGLNWLVFALLPQWELGMLLGGQDALISKVVYIVVGLAALYELVGYLGKKK